MEQVQSPALDQSVLKDAEGNKVLLVKRFSTGRKASGGGGPAKSSSLSKRVILPQQEIAKLIVNRRHVKPLVEVSPAWGDVGGGRIGGFDQGNDEGHGDIGQLVALPPEGQMVNSEGMTQGTLYISNTPSISDQPLRSLGQQLNSVLVDQDGRLTLYAEPDKMEELTPDETGVDDTAHVCDNEQEQLEQQEQQEEQLEPQSSVKEQEYSNEQESITNRTQEADGQSCDEATSRMADGDMLTGNTDVNTGDEAEAITPIVDDLKLHTDDDVKDMTDDAVEHTSGNINNKATLQTVSGGKDYKTDAQELGDGDATVMYDKPEISETPKEADSEMRRDSVKCDDSDLSTLKVEPTSDVVKSKQRRKTPVILTPVITPTRSRRIRRPPRDDLYEWTLPSMSRHDGESTRVTNETIESPTQTPAKQKRTRVVVKKEVDLEAAQVAPSEEPVDNDREKLVMPLCDGKKIQKTTTQTRSKRKASLHEMEESPDHCISNTSETAKKKPKVVSDEDEDASPAKKDVSIIDPEGSADNSTETPPVKRRRGRPKLKKDVKLEQWADAKDMASSPDVCMCSWCGKVFKNSTGLSIHENWVHKGLGQREGSTDHECSICSKVCRSFAALRNHEKQKHNVEREWACETCGAIFGKSKELKKHCMREHGEQRYECDVCHATFISREGWKIHMYKQHTDGRCLIPSFHG